MWHYTNYPIKTIIADNGETEEDFEMIDRMFEKCPLPVDIVRFGRNVRDGMAFNACLERVDTPFVVELNDDVVFIPCCPNIWDKLIEDVNNDHVGMAGPCLDRASSLAQTVEWIKLPTEVINAGFLHGACMMFKTDTIKRLGGFDTSLPGMYDLDLSIKMFSMGLNVVVDRRLYLKHCGGQTIKRVENDIQKWIADCGCTVNQKYEESLRRKFYEFFLQQAGA